MGDRVIRILNVEDEVDIQEVVKFTLEHSGFLVESCCSGKEALQKVSDLAPDLILLDVMMPDMDGFTLLKALRKLPQVAATPVIFMTALSQEHEMDRCLSAGAVHVIRKPFDPIGLASQIREICKNLHV